MEKTTGPIYFAMPKTIQKDRYTRVNSAKQEKEKILVAKQQTTSNTHFKEQQTSIEQQLLTYRFLFCMDLHMCMMTMSAQNLMSALQTNHYRNLANWLTVITYHSEECAMKVI